MAFTGFFQALDTYMAGLTDEEVPAERQAVLDPLATYIRAELAADAPVALTFICTHNSRRSHLGQLWAQTWAAYYRLEGLSTYSGGTEATACNPRTVAALGRAGFVVEALGSGDNPHYRIRWGARHPGMEAWSKVYTDAANPQQGFGAIMTCDSANEACPIVHGAAARFPILYKDPKAFDDTPQEAAAYDARCRQIAAEMRYVMAGV